MDSITILAEKVLKICIKNPDGYLYSSQLKMSSEILEKVFAKLSPYGKRVVTGGTGVLPIFQINVLGKAFIAQGGWTEKERKENENKKMYETIMNENKENRKLLRYILFTILLSLIISFVSLFVSCSKNRNNIVNTNSLGDYAYFDVNHVLHASLHCVEFEKANVGKVRGSYAVERCPLDRLTREDVKFFCTKCVDDYFYDKIINIILDNEEFEDSVVVDTLDINY